MNQVKPFDGAIDNSTVNLAEVNQLFTGGEPLETITWAADTFGNGLVMSTSFGIQSAVMLHLVTQIVPNVQVIWIDTGYLHRETHQFAKQLTTRLNLNLKVYKSSISPTQMEAKYGKLWQKNDVISHNLYDHIRKVQPMQQALQELKASAWIAGLRRQQTDYRKTLPTISKQGKYYKILPILHWTAQDIDYYLQVHNLPSHPLVKKGYVTVGDWHSSRPMMADDLNERDTRFQHLKEECGLHLNL